MIQKIRIVCASALFVCASLFAQDIPYAVSEGFAVDTGNRPGAGFPDSVLNATPQGSPAEVTEYKGSALDSLVRAKTTVYRNGRIASEKLFDAAGALSSGVEYVYAESGLLSEIRGTGADGSARWAYRYEYDAMNRLAKETSVIFQNGQELTEGSVVLSYSETGFLSARQTLSDSGAVTLRENFSYGEDGKLAEETSYYGDGSLLKRTVYEYASADVAAEQKIPAGVLTQIQRYDTNGLYETIRYEYRADGKIASVLRYGFDGVLKDTETRTYSEGKIVRRVVVNASGALSSQSYCLYDWTGNAVFERTFEGFTLREFLYPENS